MTDGNDLGMRRDTFYKIIKCVIMSGPVSRYDIASRLGLSVMTVGTAVRWGIREGYFCEQPSFSFRGRRAMKVGPSEKIKYLKIVYEDPYYVISCTNGKGEKIYSHRARQIYDLLPSENVRKHIVYMKNECCDVDDIVVACVIDKGLVLKVEGRYLFPYGVLGTVINNSRRMISSLHILAAKAIIGRLTTGE